MISLVTSAYNEHIRGDYDWINECVAAPLAHDAIGEVVVYDDGSAMREKLFARLPRSHKLTVVFGRENFGVFGGKLEAIAHASGEWVISLDSDNHIDAAVLDTLAAAPKQPDTWYMPSFAMPAFDYRPFVGTWDLRSIHGALDIKGNDCWLNTGNQMVHRWSFMRIFEPLRGLKMSQALGATDSIQFNLHWLYGGGKLNCLEGYHYHHRIETGRASNYVRAPIEKEQMSRDLLRQLRDNSTQRAQ